MICLLSVASSDENWVKSVCALDGIVFAVVVSIVNNKNTAIDFTSNIYSLCAVLLNTIHRFWKANNAMSVAVPVFSSPSCLNWNVQSNSITCDVCTEALITENTVGFTCGKSKLMKTNDLCAALLWLLTIQNEWLVYLRL